MTTDADLIAAEGTLGSWLIQTRDQILAAIAASSLAPGSIGALPNDGTAILSLKQLAIVNNAGSALVAWSTGGDGSGIDAAGHHGGKFIGTIATGSGIHAAGFDMGAGDPNTGGDGLSVQGYGVGAGLAAHGSKNCPAASTGGPGIYACADAGQAAGLQAQGSGGLAGLFAVGGATAQGALFRGGSSGGPGLRAEATGSGYPGMTGVGSGGGAGLKATIAF